MPTTTSTASAAPAAPARPAPRITIVGPGDGKAVAEIEKLIGQSIAWADGSAASTSRGRAPRPRGQPRRRREPRRDDRGGGRHKQRGATRRPPRARSPREPAPQPRAGRVRSRASSRRPAPRRPDRGGPAPRSRRSPAARAGRPGRQPFAGLPAAPGARQGLKARFPSRHLTGLLPVREYRREAAFFRRHNDLIHGCRAPSARLGTGTGNVGARRRARTHDGVRRDRVRADQGAAPAGDPAQLRGLVHLRDRLQSVAQPDHQRDAGARTAR